MAGWVALGFQRPLRTWLMLVVLGLVAVAPLWVPNLTYRFAATLVAITILVKLYDLHVGGVRPPIREFVPYLFNVFVLVYRRRHAGKPPRQKEDLRALAWAVAKTAVALPLLIWTFRASWDTSKS